MEKISKIITSTVAVILLIPFIANATNEITGLPTTIDAHHNNTVVTAFLYDGTYYDASTANPWYDGGWTGIFNSHTDSIKFLNDVNSCYLTSIPYDTCLAGGGETIGSSYGYYYDGIWNEDYGSSPPPEISTSSATTTAEWVSAFSQLTIALLLSFSIGLVMSIWIFKSYILS